MSKTRYTAVIIARNDEHTIGRCIEALNQVSTEVIVVLDDRSTDKTDQISQSLDAKVIRRPWEGFSKAKNFGVQSAAHDWILCFDADEVIDSVIISHLNQLHAQLDTIYFFNILTYIGEKPIFHSGWHPDWNIRLFNRTVMKWNDNFVHEKLVKLEAGIELEPQRITGLVHHYSFRDWDHMDQKYDHYARMRSEEWLRKGKSPTIFKRIFSPAFRFVKKYFIQLGFLDGLYGFKLALKEYRLKRKEHIYFSILKRERSLSR
jgi:glycosyltransferase involved in cell wall biosynthesis